MRERGRGADSERERGGEERLTMRVDWSVLIVHYILYSRLLPQRNGKGC